MGYPLGYCCRMRFRLADARTGLSMWTARQWWAALLATAGTFLVLAVPTALIPNPVFGREIPPTWWSYPVAVLTAVLAGMVLATYVRSDMADSDRQTTRTFTAGGLLAFFAVGCPVCNKVVLIALGTTGAMQWFAPIQPFLAAAGIAVLAWALLARLAGSVSCAVPAAESTGAHDTSTDTAEVSAQSGAAAN